MATSDACGTPQVSSESTTTTTTTPSRGAATTTTERSSWSGTTTSRAGEAATKEVSCTESLAVDLVDAPFADEVAEPWMSEKDMIALRRGVEWYFSDSNLSTDQALHHKISQHLPEGWLCCSELMLLEPLRDLGVSPQMLVKCLRWSHLETKVNLTSDELRKAAGKPKEFGNRGVWVRRRQPLPPLLSRDHLHLQGEAAVTDPAQIVLVDRHHTMNRLRDLWRVQRSLNLSEVGDDTTVFRERILPNVLPENRPPNGKPVVFAIGYERVVYGDHGPYIEFSSSQLRWKAWPHYFDKKRYNSYFNEYYTKASHSIWEAKWRMWDSKPTKGVLMLYAQNRDVSDRPWCPGAGSTDPHAMRPTGYADYRPGYFYLTADAFFVTAEHQA